MSPRHVLPDTADHDLVKNWLQNREMKDRRLAEARSGKVRTVDVMTTIDRLCEKAYEEFPQMERSAIDAFVQDYVRPMKSTSLRLA